MAWRVPGDHKCPINGLFNGAPRDSPLPYRDVKMQCLARKHIARRQERGLKIKKRRREALLVREQLVRAYVARCQRRKRKEKRIHMQLVHEKAIVLCQRRKLVEHNAAITCQSAIRGFFAQRQLQGRGEFCSLGCQSNARKTV